MSERTREEILEKIAEFESWIKTGYSEAHNCLEFTQGSLSALFWVLKMKNPYTGRDHAEV